MPFIAIALALAVALGGGVSVASQHALPGDALWGFKVGVNENIRAALAAEGKAQANFDIEAIEMRLKEAAKLAANARLSADARADLEENFEAHVESVRAQIASLEERGDYAGAADVAARFQAALAANASVLSEGAEAGASGDASAEARAEVRARLDEIMVKVRSTLDAASTISADASAKAAAQATAETDEHEDSSGAAGTVETGTSVRGGTGGIEIDTDAESQIAI